MWERLMSAWGKGPACQLEMALRYTRAFPKDFVGWIALADALGGIARYPEAQAALRKAEKTATPEHWWEIALQWGHLCRKYDEKAAERWYRKAIALSPNASTHIFLGATLIQQGRFAEAKRHCLRAIRLASDPAEDNLDEAFCNLGLILRAERKYMKALDCFRKALKLSPKYVTAREALQDVQRAMRLRKSG